MIVLQSTTSLLVFALNKANLVLRYRLQTQLAIYSASRSCPSSCCSSPSIQRRSGHLIPESSARHSWVKGPKNLGSRWKLLTANKGKHFLSFLSKLPRSETLSMFAILLSAWSETLRTCSLDDGAFQARRSTGAIMRSCVKVVMVVANGAIPAWVKEAIDILVASTAE